jgi:hypothetical protein
MHDDMLALKLSNCILRKKCEGGGDDEEELMIGYFVNPPNG